MSTAGAHRESSRGRLVVAAAGGLAFVVLVPVALVVWGHGFDGLYGQDAFFYLSYAMGPLRDALGHLAPPPDFTWPPGYPILVAGLSFATGAGSLAGQAVSVAAAASVPITTVALARGLDLGRPGGRDATWISLLAGALVALTPHLWQSAAVVMSDTAGLAFATLGAWALARWARTGGVWMLALAAAGVAFAIEIRWVYALVGIALGASGLVLAARRPDRAVAIRELVIATVVAAVVLAPMLLPIVAAAARGEPIPFALSLRSHGWDPANVLRTDFDGPDGHFSFSRPMGLFYLLEPAEAWYLGPLAVAALAGVGAVLRRPSVMRAGTLLAWPGLVMLFLAGDATQNTRFSLALMPPLAILAALGIALTVELLGRMSPGRARVGTLLVGVSVALGMASMAAGAMRITDGFVVRQQADRAAIDELASRIPSGDRVLAFGATLALRHGGIPAVELYDLGPPDIEALLADGRPTWLLVPADVSGPQWAEGSPGRDVAALRVSPGLTDAGRAGSWRLFRIGAGRGGSSGGVGAGVG